MSVSAARHGEPDRCPVTISERPPLRSWPQNAEGERPICQTGPAALRINTPGPTTALPRLPRASSAPGPSAVAAAKRRSAGRASKPASRPAGLSCCKSSLGRRSLRLFRWPNSRGLRDHSAVQACKPDVSALLRARLWYKLHAPATWFWVGLETFSEIIDQDHGQSAYHRLICPIQMYSVVACPFRNDETRTQERGPSRHKSREENLMRIWTLAATAAVLATAVAMSIGTAQASEACQDGAEAHTELR